MKIFLNFQKTSVSLYCFYEPNYSAMLLTESMIKVSLIDNLGYSTIIHVSSWKDLKINRKKNFEIGIIIAKYFCGGDALLHISLSYLTNCFRLSVIWAYNY